MCVSASRHMLSATAVLVVWLIALRRVACMCACGQGPSGARTGLESTSGGACVRTVRSSYPYLDQGQHGN